MNKNRIHNYYSINEHLVSVDVLRIICIFAVICIHTEASFRQSNNDMAYIFIHYLPRFAVPVFFIIAGFFWARSMERDFSKMYFRAYLKKIVILFSSWTIIYRLVIYISRIFLGQRRSAASVDSILNLPFVGYNHLWFLVSLALGLIILYCFVKTKQEKYIFLFSVSLYAIALLGKDYSLTPLGLYRFPEFFNTRHGPFVSCLFLAIGWNIFKSNRRVTFLSAFSLVILGFFTSFLEIYCLKKFDSLSSTHPEFLIGTVPLASGFFLMALARSTLGRNCWLEYVGKNIVGVYVVHDLVVLVISRCSRQIDSVVWHIVFPCLVFLLSLLIVFLLNKFQFTSWLVTGRFERYSKQRASHASM